MTNFQNLPLDKNYVWWLFTKGLGFFLTPSIGMNHFMKVYSL